MKKRFLLLIGFFTITVLNLPAANRYWIGGTGNWTDISHWTSTSGGIGGSSVPTANDDVFFDQHSFSADKQAITVASDIFCRNMDWSAINHRVAFISAKTNTLSVSGSYILSPLLINGFTGQTNFTSSLSTNIIKTEGRTITGNWVFDGLGAWLLDDDLTTESLVSISLIQGSLNTNGKKINCGSFIGNSVKQRSLNLSNSEILIKNSWDFNSPTNLNFNSGTSQIVLEKTIDNNHFKGGNLSYNSVSNKTPASCVYAQFTINMTETDVTCNGAANGTATATVIGGTGPFTYTWIPAPPVGQGTSTASGYGPGTFTVQIKDLGTGITHICSIAIAEPSKLFVVEGTVVTPLCFGDNNGSAEAVGVQGSPPYNFLWNDPLFQSGTAQLTDTATSLAAGTYTVYITDSHSCLDSTSIIVTQPNLLVAPGSSANISCNAACDGTASVIPSGGSTPYSYSWVSTPAYVISGSSTANVTNLCPGTYTCTVTDSNACVTTYNTTIIEPNVLTLNQTQTNVTCGGLCNGTATATITGGTAPYTYVWTCGGTVTTPSLSNTVSGLCIGPCTVTVTDANGCSKNVSFTITQPPILVATATGTNISCFNACDGTATATVTGGTSTYTYVWSTSASTGPTASLTNTINSLCANSYTVTVTDINGCNDTGVVALTQPAVLDASATKTDVLCFGACNGTATAGQTGGTGPYTYFWKTVPVAQQTLQTITNLCPGTYTVIVTDSHLCEDSTTVTISQPTQITIAATGTSVTCFGACDGTALGTPSGGTQPYSYSWTGPAIGVPAGNTDFITNLCNGTYTLVVTDAAGCKDTATVALTQPNPFTVSITNTPILCNGNCNATATTTVVGGTPLYNYSWTSSLGPPPPPLSTISSLCAGTYTVIVTDLNSCTAKDTVIITEPTVLNVSSTVVNATCFNTNSGSACLIASGGTPIYVYAWSPGGEVTACINNQPAGTYSYTVTDANNCTDTASITITEPNILLANPSVISNLTCNNVTPCDGTATSIPTGGTPPFTYLWNDPLAQTTSTISNLCIGTWNVTVTDSNSCVSTQPVTITQPTPLSVNISNTTSSCNVCNGTATVVPSGGTPGYSYVWAPAPGGGQGTATATGLCANVVYTCTITDANGCTASRTVTISQTVIISITTTNTTLSCFGSCDGIATANASGGSGVYDYFWGPGNPTGQGTPTITNLCAGTYWITVTDTTGCFNTDTIVFSNPPLLIASATSINESCFGMCDATATASYVGGTGPVTYLWAVGGQTTPVATALCVGNYTVTITDSLSCTDTASVSITQPTAILDNYSKIDATCTQSDGSITVAPTGGSGVYSSYVWTGSAAITTGQGTASITNLGAGTYTLVITDNTGCSFTFNYFINNTNAPSIVITSTPITCFGDCNGTAKATVTGGTLNYVYNWTPGSPSGFATDSINSLCSATYTLQVTDAIGCIAFDTISVLDPALISPNPVIVDESCGGSCDGSITLNPTGGTGPGTYTYAWTNGLGTPMPATSSQTNLCANGSPYTVTVTDANGCDSVLAITITSPPTLTATISITNVNCFNACDGTAKVTPSGGTPPYSHSWSHGAIYILDSVINLCPGIYTDTVTDFKGCSVIVTDTITEPTQLIAVSSQVNVSCYNMCDGSAAVLASGGTLSYSYAWNPMVTTNITGDSAISLCNGTYNVTVTDGNGCQAVVTPIVITQPTQIVVNATSINPTCNLSCNGTAISNPTGGSGIGYTYLWNSVPAQATQSADSLCAGTYNVIVTDNQGCTNNQNVTLVDPAVLNANAFAIAPTCYNSCNGSVAANPVGGTPGFTYSWQPGGQVSQIVLNECPGVYTLIVTDLKLCKDTQTVVVTNPLPLDVIVGSTPATCGFADGTMTITPITGTASFTYVWSPITPPMVVAGQNATQMVAGVYSITVTDANGCDSTFVETLNNSGGPTGEVVSTTDLVCNAICSGIGSVDSVIGGTAPFTFLWSSTVITNDTATNLCAGSYIVTITDSNSCIHFTDPIVINQPAPIVPNEVITDAACSTVCNGTISVAPTGGTGGVYTYAWAPGNPAGQGTPTITSLCPGSYTLTLTDAVGCTEVDTFIVGQSAPLNVTISSTNSNCSSVCNGMSYVTISAGTPPYMIQWNNGQVNDTAIALCAGIYTAVILDSLGCSASVTDTITSAPPIIANAAITDATCGSCNGQVLLSPTGGAGSYSYVWSNVSTTYAIDSNLCAGLYSVDITDGVGCVLNVNIPVSNTGGPDSATIASTNATCFGVCDGAVTGITPFGGTPPYTYLWIQNGATTTTLTNLCAGVYFVQITDSLGCSLIDSVTITEPGEILANQLVTAATCGVCNGSIIIAPSGGAGSPYTAVWNVPAVPAWDTLTNLCAGIYSVALTDANGCGQNVVIPVNNFNGPTLSITSTDVICNDSCNGTATVTVLSGVFPYVYSWNDALLQQTPTADSLCPGTYFVQVTGADLCVSIISATITEPTPIGFSVANIQNPLCNADTNGTITIFPSGGVLTYIYSWSSPASSITNTAINLGAATYITTVTDANGCVAMQTNTLTEPPVLTISHVATDPSCSTLSDGAIDITVGGGTPVYSYLWSNTAITEDLTSIPMGTYSLTVADVNGCQILDTITLTPTTIVIADAGNDTSFCLLNSVILNATGSTNATIYSWYEIPSNNPAGTGSVISVTPSDTMSYYVVVDNGLGCMDNDTVNVISYPLPVASAGTDITILTGASTIIGGNPTGPAGSTYIWSPLPGLDNSTNANPSANPLSTTTYTVSVTSVQGCVSNDSIVVTILPNITFGNGISPNGDGVNDEWEIDFIDMFPENTVEVYNRWGELLFQSKGYKEKWDGTYKGQLLPVGTYYYIINLNDPLFPDAYTGPITIMR